MANAPRPRHHLLALLAALPLLLACTVPAPRVEAPAGASTTTATAAATSTPPPAPSPASATPTPTPRTRMVVPTQAVEIESGTTSRREIAFTFDCAAHSGPTDEILRVLREERVRVTWFMVGVWARDHQELTKEIAREHEIANHSWAHPDYRDLTAAEIAADLEENERFLLALTGQSTKPLWRAPSGARDQRVLEAAAAAGWPLHIFWTIGQDERGTVTGDTGDWRGIPAAEVWANTVRAAGLGPGLITVSHCDAPSTAAVMRDTIRLFRERGLEIVTVSELLRP
jgi:peptidoglycan/xylan/chitin deacetylase (PgdA/CDA1 family)